MFGTKQELIYLACPYTHPDAEVRLQRFQQVTKAAAALILQGRIVFSPITMTHPIDLEMAGVNNTLGSDFWVTFDQAFMERCDIFALFPLADWQNSSGVRRELEYFKAAGKPLMILDQDFQLKPYEWPPSDIQTGAPIKRAR